MNKGKAATALAIAVALLAMGALAVLPLSERNPYEVHEVPTAWIFLHQIFSIIKQIIRILHYIIKQSLLFIFRNKNTTIANSSLAILQFIQ